MNNEIMSRGSELTDAQLDSVVGGGVWGWVKDKAKKVGNWVGEQAKNVATGIASAYTAWLIKEGTKPIQKK